MAGLSIFLRKRLQAYSTEMLAQIVDTWALDLSSDNGWDLTLLGELLQNSIAARFAWDSLSPSAREILRQMIVFEVMDGVPREDLQKLVHLPDTDYIAALKELELRLMLLEDKP